MAAEKQQETLRTQREEEQRRRVMERVKVIQQREAIHNFQVCVCAHEM